MNQQKDLAHPVAEEKLVLELGKPRSHQQAVSDEKVLEWNGLIKQPQV